MALADQDQPVASADRQGGTAVWAPSITPPIGAELTDEQALACAFRVLARDGFAENLSGHITWQRSDTTDMLVNPWGLWWRELRASDICTVDEDAHVVAGRWDVTPAIHIHTELHRVRPDARVVIHNHPYYVCLVAALGVMPELLHQTGSLFLDDLCFVEEYSGEVDTADLAGELARRIGSASVAILGNHGVVVTGHTLEEATYRAASIDRVCRLAYDVLVTGREPLRMRRAVMVGMKESLVERAADVYWAGAVRALLRAEPDVLG
ncbi:class II aldolase/adducin family protein [Iamia majanohamensis]|uniref:Class II aldolase/adducin family protein n=1 Tax=Iamia majanohamensis TaxID=467976 RepID=A0AAE9Y6H5_9ACTN|nr:class II aldolase/adducin family protein [Iamia majanohamensis]WCO67820.1 class II aldolase/adducin family protein [Iamia majanohamensis]